MIEGRLDGVDTRIGGIEGRLDGMEARLGRVEGRLDGIEVALKDQGELLRQILAKVA